MQNTQNVRHEAWPAQPILYRLFAIEKRDQKKIKKEKLVKNWDYFSAAWRIWPRLMWTTALVVGLLVPIAQPAQAQDQQIGYLWSLYFDFDSSYNGVLTIEVGPWENGELTSVNETSSAMVRCEPVGNVQLQGGDAVFDGNSYLSCALDLGEVVWNNHGLQIDDVDSYGSMVMRARVNSAANGIAPLVRHPDATYSADFTATQSVAMSQDLWNEAGVSGATFNGVMINQWYVLTYLYACISNGGPCDATFAAGGQMQTKPTAGDRISFSTEATSFEIGRDGGNYFTGRIDSILIDPGNSVH
jgi:hypothetical protein